MSLTDKTLDMPFTDNFGQTLNKRESNEYKVNQGNLKYSDNRKSVVSRIVPLYTVYIVAFLHVEVKYLLLQFHMSPKPKEE